MSNVTSVPPSGSLKEPCLESCHSEPSKVDQSLGDRYSQNTLVEEIRLAHRQLHDEDLSIFLKQLPQSVEVVDLTGNYCRSKGAAAIAELLQQDDRRLTTINLTNQHPGECGGSLDLSILGLSVASNTSLQHLDLSFNMLTYIDIESLVVSLVNNTVLQSINLMSNALDDKAMHLIGKNLPGFHGLKKLNILGNRFGETGADALLQGLKTNVHLCELTMPRGFLSSEEIDFYLTFNKGGRRLLHSHSPAVPFPLGIWQIVFERINRLNPNEHELRATIIFHLLQGPVLFGKPPAAVEREVPSKEDMKLNFDTNANS